MKYLIAPLLLFSFLSLAKDNISYALLDLDTGKIIEKKDELKPKYLASVSKIFTTHYALSNLGADHHFKTELFIKGKIKNKVLDGDLILVGNGAPYLTAPHLISLIHQVKKSGIDSVSGQFIIDDTALKNTTQISDLGLEDQPDNPSFGALNVEFNRVNIFPNKEESYPPMDYLEFKKSQTKNHGLKFDYVSNEKGKEIWQINSKEKLRSKEVIPVKDSALFTGSLFQYLAIQHKLNIPAPMRGGLPARSKLVASHEGVSTERLSALCLEYSNNLIAEALLKSAAKKQKGVPLTSHESAKLMYEWYKNKYSDLEWDQLSLYNGSGLTIYNTASAKLMTNALKKLSQESYSNRSFWSLLSINGHSGGLVSRLQDPKLAYRIYGKTGSLYYVNNLAGYLIADSGKKYAYAIFITEDEKREQLNKPNSKRNQLLRAQYRKWYYQARNVQDDLLETWIKKH